MYLSAASPVQVRTAYSTSATPSRRTFPFSALTRGRIPAAVLQRRRARRMVKLYRKQSAHRPIVQTGILQRLRTITPPSRRAVPGRRVFSLGAIRRESDQEPLFVRAGGDSPISDPLKVIRMRQEAKPPVTARIDTLPVNVEQPTLLVPSTKPPVVSSNPIDSYAINQGAVDLLPTETVFDAATEAGTLGGKAGWLILGLVVFGASMLLGSPPGRKAR